MLTTSRTNLSARRPIVRSRSRGESCCIGELRALWKPSSGATAPSQRTWLIMPRLLRMTRWQRMRANLQVNTRCGCSLMRKRQASPNGACAMRSDLRRVQPDWSFASPCSRYVCLARPAPAFGRFRPWRARLPRRRAPPKRSAFKLRLQPATTCFPCCIRRPATCSRPRQVHCALPKPAALRTI